MHPRVTVILSLASWLNILTWNLVLSGVSDGKSSVNAKAWSKVDLYISDKNNTNVTSVSLDADLTLRLTLSGDEYSAMQPYECYFADAFDPLKTLYFVRNRCPQPPVYPIGKMQKVSETSFSLSFKAFAFNPAPVTQLNIYCQVTLCIEMNVDQFCNDSCWRASADDYQYSNRIRPVNRQSSIDSAHLVVKLGNILADDGPWESAVLIITDKNVSTVSPVTPPSANTSLLYIMYGVAAFFAFLFLILLTGIIVYMCCCSPNEKNRAYSRPQAMAPQYVMSSNLPQGLITVQPNTNGSVPKMANGVLGSSTAAQCIVPPIVVDPVFSNVPGQAPYCDWQLVFRIPRVFSNSRNGSQASAATCGQNGHTPHSQGSSHRNADAVVGQQPRDKSAVSAKRHY